MIWPRRLFLLIFVLILVFVFFLIFVAHWTQFQRICGYHFKIGATFGTRDHVTFLQFIFIQIKIAVTFRTQNHYASSLSDCLAVADAVCIGNASRSCTPYCAGKVNFFSPLAALLWDGTL